MAISLSTTHPFLCSPFQPPKPPLVSQNTPSFSFFLPTNSYHSLSISSPLFNHSKYSFNCFVSPHDDPFYSVEAKKEDEEANDKSKKKWESVETLTRFYKEAVLAGDYHTVTEIETALYRLETEKNELVEKFSTVSEEITAGKEKLIRLQADFDNFRKRSEKERLSIRSDAQGEVIESMLPMVDNFERAKQQIKPETDREKQIDTSYQGIYKQFVEIMRSLRVSAVATVGKPFDPSFHEAIAREESDEFKEGTVSQEFRRGFILGDRLLRPAMVKVSTGPGKKKDTATQNTTRHPAATASGMDEP